MTETNNPQSSEVVISTDPSGRKIARLPGANPNASWAVDQFVLDRFSTPLYLDSDEGAEILERYVKTAPPVVQAYLHANPHISPGAICRVSDGAPYEVTKPGTFVVVTMVPIDFNGEVSTFDDRNKHQVICKMINMAGRLMMAKEDFAIDIEYLEPVSPKVTTEILESWRNPPPPKPRFKDGTPVVLTETKVLVARSFFGTNTFKVEKGTKGVIDVPPNGAGSSVNDINDAEYTPATMEINFHWCIESPLHAAGRRLGGKVRDGLGKVSPRLHPQFQNWKMEVPLAEYGWKYKVYVPSIRAHIEVDQSILAERDFDADALGKVIMDSHKKRKVLAAVSPTADKWGLSFKKGNGRMVLLGGEPGMGKTLIAESAAEVQRRPLYIIDNRMFGSTADEFEAGLQKALEVIKRWHAIGLWDECEVYLRTRRDDQSANTRVGAALRMLEHFEGDMILTTNKPEEIDPAVRSRCQVTVFFDEFTAEQRAQIWAVTLPKTIPFVGVKEVLVDLANLPLSGRDIKSVIQSAAQMAAAEGLEEVPAAYLLHDARELLETKEKFGDGPMSVITTKLIENKAEPKNGEAHA